MNLKFPAILISGLIVFGLELLISIGVNPGLSLRIAAGFLSLFFLPGYVLAEMFLSRETDFLDRFGFSFIFSLGLFSYPALLFFLLELNLNAIFQVFFLISLSVWLIFLFRTSGQFFKSPINWKVPRQNWEGKALILILVIGSGIIAWHTGAYRRPGHDWDFYNYITMVRKFLVWGKAGIHHYFYLDAPPDPIHSYNLEALVWALIARQNRIDPIPLYIHSVFLTVPLCFLAFYGMARRALGPRAGFIALSFYFCYQLFYGGLFFTRRSNFYPDDSMWMLGFPALFNLAFLFLEQKKARLIPLLAFSSLAVSVIHPLWGLIFYLTISFFLLLESLRAGNAFRHLREKPWRGADAIVKSLLLLLVGAPYLMSLAYLIVKSGENPRKWFEPIFPGFALDRLWFYIPVLIIVPILLFLFLSRPFSKSLLHFQRSDFYQKGYAKGGLFLILLCLLIALPYAYLRFETIQSTQWSSFGRNPYRGLITPNLFLLNPFIRSFDDPNMIQHPFFWIGLIFSPFLLWLARRHSRPGAAAAFAALIGTILLVLHPVMATIFAKFFTLGYLRRLLRLPALLAFLAPAAFLEWIFIKFRLKDYWAYLIALTIPPAVAWLLIFVPGDPLYHNLFREMRWESKPEFRETLFWDDAPFQFLRDQKLIRPEDVVYSDIFTSFRLTAYLDCYVAVQHKPGVGVPDQDQRRLEEMIFFSPDTSLELMLQILDRRKADWVIINRNPEYRIPSYNLPFAHPETIAKLTLLPQIFEKVYDRDDWVIFRRKGWEASAPLNPPAPE